MCIYIYVYMYMYQLQLGLITAALASPTTASRLLKRAVKGHRMIPKGAWKQQWRAHTHTHTHAYTLTEPRSEMALLSLRQA